MKLSQIKTLVEDISADEFTVKKWDGNEPEEGYIPPFDVTVTYKKEDLGNSYHPYGQGSAREQHGISVFDIMLKTAELVKLMNDDGDKIIKTFPIGTPIAEIPGWEESYLKYFSNKAEDHAEENM